MMVYEINGEYWDELVFSCYNTLGSDMMDSQAYFDYVFMYMGYSL